LAKVFLINPGSPERYVTAGERYIALGPLYLSSYLKKNGHQTRFVDINNEQIARFDKKEAFELQGFYAKRIKKIVDDFQPDLIGVSVHYSGRFRPALEVIELLKKEYPRIPIVIGGIHPTIFPQSILEEYPIIDFIIQGEGEVSLTQLVETVAGGKSAYADIDGLAYRTDGKVVVNPKTNFIEKMDEIPFPDYDLIDLKEYYFDTSKWFNPKGLPIHVSVFILSSRSCPRRCTYCSMFMAHGPTYRARSAENVVDEIEYLYHRFNQRYFSFMDDNFTLNKPRALKICQEIADRKLDIQFDTPNGLDLNTLDEDVLRALVGAGLIRTCLAVESGSPEIRKSIHKRIKQEKIYEVFEAVKKFPTLVYNVFFIIGFPNETFETLEETYRLIKKLELKSAVLSFATPFPGTKLYEECVANHLIEMDYSKFHNFENLYYAHKDPFIKPYKLDKKDLVDFRLKVYKELNLTRYLKNLV